MKSFKEISFQFLRGIAMGTADVVPGVSGGTIALLLGIYERLIKTIKIGSTTIGVLLRGDFHGAFKKLCDLDWWFLIPLLTGIVIAVIVLASTVENLLLDYPEEMAGLFLGLVGASVVVVIRMLESWNWFRIGTSTLVSIATFVILGFSNGPIVEPSTLVLLGAGAAAISAWILPGISGSFLLLMLGMYSSVLNAIENQIFGDLLILAIGAIIGLSLFTTILAGLLKRYRNAVLAILIGLMIGSLRVLWPWPNGVGIISQNNDNLLSGTKMTLPTSGTLWAPLAITCAAFIATLGLDFIWKKKEKQY
tara:strand:- start:773 stop:1693 length:921 start_codon:yes stop_codon:yes gene_type:complete